ncbi:porin [Elioraea rosea]|uniref:porin n=1 Tax=Elioraea rosea TaxID=2492390 RepID=UPI0011852F2B|nr:porin [Elioraea rosea]
MRKILLATAAGFAAFVADGVAPARAQAGTEVTGQATPTPGITARFNGRYRMYMGWVDQDTTVSDPVTGAKEQDTSNIDFIDYARLFAGFDGVAANGLRYGATLEIRMGSGGNAPGDTRSGLFYRRAWGYVGTPTLGQIRVGSGPTGAVETMHVGHITGFGSGGWDGDAPGFVIGANPSDSYWYSSSGRNNYTKIGYFSPQFFGFDLGLSYGPNDGEFGGDGSCSFANFAGAAPANCDRLDETITGAPLYRAQDIYEIMLRYRGTFGPVGVAVSGGYVGSGVVDNLAPADVSAKGLSVGVGGATVSWAGLTVGGIISGGRANLGAGSFGAASADGTLANLTATNAFTGGSLTPRLDVPGGDNSDMFTWSIGAQYTFGPFVVGAQWSENESAGSQLAGTGKRERTALAIGGTWNIAPGLALFLEYLYGKVEEDNVNIITGAAGTTANNSVDVNLVSLGISFQW